jgi:general secretion pathway protein H
MLINNQKQRAFTLIEVLVILIIVSIITAVAVLAFGQFGRGRREKIIVQQFTRTITAAQQQAILTPMVLGLTITSNGYQFYQFHTPLKKPSEWLPLKNDVLSNPQAFRSIFEVNVKSIATFSLSQQDKKTPAILFLSSGYVTPFTLELKSGASVFQIVVKNNGVVDSRTK